MGDVQGKRPGFTNLKGRAKYDAWKEIAGLDAEGAMQQYIDLVARATGIEATKSESVNVGLCQTF